MDINANIPILDFSTLQAMHNPIIDLFVKCQSGNKAKWLLKQDPIKTSSKFKRFIELRQTDTAMETIGDNLDHRDWSH